MTRAGLLARWNDWRERMAMLRSGLPHGVNPHIDVNRRLTRTKVRRIFDVGANNGQSAVAFRRWYPDAAIHCFEPVASTFAVLQRTVQGYEQVTTHRLAFGSASGARSMAVGGDSRMASLGGAEPGTQRESIEVDTIDAFCARAGIDSIDYLKIDTEGHDLEVLKGAEAFLGAGRAAIVEVEAGMNVDNRYHESADTLTAALRLHRYRLFGVYEQVLEWPTADAFLRRANLLFVSEQTVRDNHWQGDA